MKILLTLAMTVIGTGIAFATTGDKKAEKKTVSINYANTGTVNLTVFDDSKGKVDVEIYDESGEMIFDESIRYKSSFTVPINMSTQEEGNYTFLVKGEDIDHEQVVYNNKRQEEDVYASVREVKDNIYDVRVFHENVPVVISISDEDGNSLYRKKYIEKSNFQQRFDLNQYQDKILEISISGKKSYYSKVL